MAVLSRSEQNPSMVTVQCDVCCPPPIATNDERALVEAGWRMAAHGADVDFCPAPHRRVVRRSEWAGGLDSGGGSLPNLLIIGAAKCGTTSLHAYLDTHPDIAMAELKELRFFSDPDCKGWLPWYRQQFRPDAAVRGESSTMYTRSPALPGTAGRMHDVVPDAKLIYMVRDPIDRAVASYLEERFQLFETRPIEDAFADLDDPYNPYVSASRYAEQLHPYLARYPMEQVLVLPLADLASDPDGAFRRVWTFLDVDPAHVVDTASRLNEGADKYQYGATAARLRRGVAGRVVARIPSGPRTIVRTAARRILRRPLERPDLPSELRDRLREALAPDARAFRDLTGLTLSDWSV